MTPEGQRRLHRAVHDLFDFRMYWLHEEMLAVVDAGRSDPVLRCDIAHLMGGHQRDFDEGWRHHWLPENGFYMARIPEPDGMKRLLEGFWPWEARSRRN